MDAMKELAGQLAQRFHPEKILLFGSQAKGTATEKSDVDLCVVAQTDNKRRTLAEMYDALECEKPVDILLYTPREWAECLLDPLSFAYKINREGIVLYG